MKKRYFNLRINIDNDVFTQGGIFEELPLILNSLANRYKCNSEDKNVFDSNGNYIGYSKITIE